MFLYGPFIKCEFCIKNSNDSTVILNINRIEISNPLNVLTQFYFIIYLIIFVLYINKFCFYPLHSINALLISILYEF